MSLVQYLCARAVAEEEAATPNMTSVAGKGEHSMKQMLSPQEPHHDVHVCIMDNKTTRKKSKIAQFKLNTHYIYGTWLEDFLSINRQMAKKQVV